MNVNKQKILNISIVIGLICSLVMQLIIPGIGVLAESDSTPPTLESMEVTPQEVNVGDTVTIRIKAKDDIAGVKSVNVKYKTPSNNRTEYITLWYRATEGVWEGSYTIQPTDEGGVWTIDYIALTDYAGNLNLLTKYSGNLPLSEITNITVNNQAGDSTPPVFESIVVSPQNANVGETVTIRIKAKDDIAGVKSVNVKYKTPSNNRTEYITLWYRAMEGTWEGSYTIQPTDEGGVWTIDYIALTDYAGNLNLLTKYSGNLPLSEITNITVNNQAGDSTPPVFESIVVSPQNANVGETVTIRIKAKDDIAGVKSVNVKYKTPSNNRTEYITLWYRAMEGTWEGSYTIQPTDESGEWTVDYIALTDQADNLNLLTKYSGNLPDNSLSAFTVNNEPIVDTTPPTAPEVNQIKDNDTEIVGFAEAKSTVSVKLGIHELGSAITDENGNFMIPVTPQKVGTILTITATDKGNNISEPVNVTVIDGTHPEKPVVNEVTDKSDVLTGTAEPGSMVTVKSGTQELAWTDVKEDGKFEVTIPIQKAGTKLVVTATDQAGNNSESQEITIKDVTNPEKPIVHEVTDKLIVLTGTAEPGSTVTIKSGTQELATTVVKEDGTFEVTIRTLKAGTKLIVTATDQAGNKSEAQEITVKDVTKPEKPAVNEVTDKSTTIIGTAEAGATIAVKAGTEEIGSAVVTEDGTFTISIPVQSSNNKLTITATDTAGNQSEALEIMVKDTTPPQLTGVNEVTSETTLITGTAEPGAIVSVLHDSELLGSVNAADDGRFVVSISQQSADTKLLVKATDLKGNESELYEIVVKSTTPPVQPQYFTDIKGHWAENEMIKLYELGLVKGYTDGSFGVSKKITRAEVASIITRHLKLEGTPSTFSDVPSNYWASNVIGAIQANKIMSGYNDGTFKPNAPITRAEIASIIERAYNLKGEGTIGFKDVPSTHWAYKPISVLVVNNLTSGFSDNTFRPNADLSRAEFAAFLSRVIN